MLRDAEIEVLAAVGAFRVVPENELLGDRGSTDRSLRDIDKLPRPHASDIRSLSEQGLLLTRTIVVNHRAERVLVLTRAGQHLLEAHRADSGDTRHQQYYSGLVKPRELAHDAQLYRLFQTERSEIERDGGRVRRVVLDYELKRDYHGFVHEARQRGLGANEARRQFAAEQGLPIEKGHVQIPDVRIEYEEADGRQAHRDLELATEHYSRSQLAGKQAAGFRVYRAAGATGNNRAPRGAPFDPHHLEWIR